MHYTIFLRNQATEFIFCFDAPDKFCYDDRMIDTISIHTFIIVFLSGWAILLAALAFNAILISLGWPTWYTLVEQGWSILTPARFIVVFLVYPLVLGATGFMTAQFVSSLIR